MNIGGSVLWAVAQLRPVLPALIAAVVATVVVFIVLSIYVHNVWVREERFALAGLFFGMDGRDTVRLACAWLRLIFMLVFLISFQKLELVNYELILLPGILFSLAERKPARAGANLLWLLLDLAGLLSVNLICGYVRDMDGGLVFVLIYIAMALFLVLFNVYLFLNELDYISDQRTVDPERIWGGKADLHGEQDGR